MTCAIKYHFSHDSSVTLVTLSDDREGENNQGGKWMGASDKRDFLIVPQKTIKHFNNSRGIIDCVRYGHPLMDSAF